MRSILLLLAGACVGLGSRPRRGVEQDFWSGSSANYYSEETPAGVPFMDIPVYGESAGDTDLDKIQVVSSSLRILPKNKVRGNREVEEFVRVKREPLEVQSWRRPRQHQFVTNTAERLAPPAIVRVYPPGDRGYERDRGVRKSQRRIIYYANLPEIVRPPVQWYRGDYYNNRQNYISPSPSSYSPSVYPSTSDNEITRVQSNIIDVTNPRYNYNGYSTNSKFSYNTPKFTIIDVDPPYSYRAPYTHRPPVRFDPYPPPNSFYDIRTPPYRDHSYYSSQNYRPTSSLEPVKLQIPTSTDLPSSTANATEPPANTTRFLPDNLPVSLRALSKFVT